MDKQIPDYLKYYQIRMNSDMDDTPWLFCNHPRLKFTIHIKYAEQMTLQALFQEAAKFEQKIQEGAFDW